MPGALLKTGNHGNMTATQGCDFSCKQEPSTIPKILKESSNELVDHRGL